MSASSASPSIWLSNSNSTALQPVLCSVRSWAIRSMSSRITVAGWSNRASVHDSSISPRPPPVSSSTVRSGIRPSVVHRRQRLARARRPVRSKPRFKCRPACRSRSPCRANPTVRRSIAPAAPRQDDALALDGGQVVEGDAQAVPRTAQRNDLTAVDIALAHRGADGGQERRGGRPLGGHDLELDLLVAPAALARAAHQHRQPLGAGVDQVETGVDAGQDAIAVERDVDVLDRPLGEPWPAPQPTPRRRHELRQRHHMLVRGGDADHLGAAAGFGQVGVERQVEVGVVIMGERLAEDRQPRQVGLEMGAQPAQEERLFGGRWTATCSNAPLNDAMKSRASACWSSGMAACLPPRAAWADNDRVALSLRSPIALVRCQAAPRGCP